MDKSSSCNFSWAASQIAFQAFVFMICVFRCWQQCSTYNLFENLHTDLLLVETSKLWQKQAKMNFFCVRWCMIRQEHFIHKNLEILALSSSLSSSQGSSNHAARDWLRESVKGLTGGIQSSFRLGKTFKITESCQEIQRGAADEEMECLGCT